MRTPNNMKPHPNAPQTEPETTAKTTKEPRAQTEQPIGKPEKNFTTHTKGRTQTDNIIKNT
jgi:hypothetical protein